MRPALEYLESRSHYFRTLSSSFNRYFFAQQDKLGAVIDERYNGGGLLDDYMVDLMTRRVRAAYTNEVPGAAPG